MMFKCCECGHLFEEGEQAVWEERHGLDTPPYEEWSGCPLCKGGYAEAARCNICGGWFSSNDVNEGCCEECLSGVVSDYRYSPQKCFSLSQKEKAEDSVSLDFFLAAMFSKGEIEEILWRELRSIERYSRVDCQPFINADKDWFIECAVAERG